ncbi:MAG: ABC-F family ATP-binding cassette domain-containing protein [Microcoleus sp. PH2017_01_SCD_O_A]|jgi:ATP-binding cassette subfamily F protein 3|uniref:ABC-F family ATP-binding cassette domain-containing protein n=2 Tax=Microcoleus TaxID=44471 RepID=UPI001DDD221F|nr:MULTISPECIES: ABC-F family ATP-binding cassette domain-containing protein [unclassified Microcoleus]MCC3440234.1 ABC-F family ATP-binding cassette domain-containing protein [Microcoleus sp. PH2017_03_ELD_O_A]MCC3468513.1 ABC-F family ATP-binding cassette domain-containing protein [Microcoleus sp. PH2017_06_SFM_O_A]TAE16215.1 MAG: ABC transporter ATP-binding protein [Oscillatoriales cyanobacterium]MCC3423855.1 ABC-F family ATP-binding cassette domain-containing protein [Microcoleus sp. PH2017
MLRLEHISKIYPTGVVLKDVTWEVKPGDRIGLVGVNGAGKSTQLKIIAGEMEPTSGEVIRPASLHIAYLSQEFEIDPTRTVKEEFWRAFSEANEVHESLMEVHRELEAATPENLDNMIHKMDRLQRQFEGLNGYGLEAQIEKILPEIGFEQEDGDRLVSAFSGGWQMRMSLGKILLQKPDILLLDEPTNHLDLETIEWLEVYLKGLTTPMVIVSHDREFLDRLCTQIVETERGVSSTYLGNYSSYLLQKAEAREAQLSAYENQQKELDKQQAFVEKFRASATRSTQAKSREKQLDKIERIEAPTGGLKTLHFRFPPAPRSGREVAIIENLVHTYGEKILFLGADLLIERGDRIAFLGPNGAGKSTLLRLIMGLETPTEGTVKMGGHNVIPGYFEQNQAEALDLNKSVMQTIHDEVPDWKNEEVRTLLGRFLFNGETVFKHVGALSGGEKARLALAKMLLEPVNLLILDEPTNHLDIPAKEMMEEAIKNYDGTVIIVSHDRYFISQVANKIVEVRDGEFRTYLGDYHYYLDKITEEKELAKFAKLEAEKAAKKSEKEAKKKAAAKQK